MYIVAYLLFTMTAGVVINKRLTVSKAKKYLHQTGFTAATCSVALDDFFSSTLYFTIFHSCYMGLIYVF